MDAFRLKETLSLAEAKALELLKEKEKVEELLGEAEAASYEHSNFNESGKLLDEMFALTRAYLNHEFTDCEDKDLAPIVAAALYLVNEDDAIPDHVPVIGVMDDAAIIELAYKKCENVIRKYKGE